MVGSFTIKFLGAAAILTILECRARPDLPEIHLFWTSTWGEEDRVLVDLDASPSAVEARSAKHSGDLF